MTDNTDLYIAFVPKGDSMWPFLKNKKQTVLINKNLSQVFPYDVILYKRENGNNILHRVVDVTEEFYICSGDSQFVTEKVKKDQVVGVMAGYYKGKKYVVFDNKQRKKAERYYKRRVVRKIKVKLFLFRKRVIGKIKRTFGKN